MMRIPFKLPDIAGGLREGKGLLFLDDEFLVFEVSTALLGEFAADSAVIKIEPAALEEIRLERRLFFDRLYVRPKKGDLLEAMPGRHDFEVELRVRRRYRPDLERLLVDVERRRRFRTAAPSP